jgi:hypothetical protein
LSKIAPLMGLWSPQSAREANQPIWLLIEIHCRNYRGVEAGENYSNLPVLPDSTYIKRYKTKIAQQTLA